MQLISRLLRVTRLRPSPQIVVVAAWIAGLGIVEVVGRHSTSDLADALLLMFLGFLGILTALVHSLRTLAVLQAGTRFAKRSFRALARLNVEFGVDLRGTPEVQRGFPPAWSKALLLLLLLTAAIGAASPWSPSTIRALVAPRFYLAWLVPLGALWVASLLAVFLLGFLIWAGIHDRFVESYTGQRDRPLRNERLMLAGLLVVLFGAAALLPAWAPIVLISACLVLVTVALSCSGQGLSILWRARKDQPLRAFDGRLLLWLHWIVPLTIAADLLLLSRGELLWRNESLVTSDGNPLTLALGALLGWTTVAAAGLALWHSLRFARLWELGRPILPPQPGQSSPAEDRRQEIAHRRNIVRGLEKLFKRAARQTRRRGTGLWIGLQHWFILGLSPDESGPSREVRESTIIDGIVGAPFHWMVTTSARRHYRQITSALEIDLILVEHGVPFRRLVRVLRMMFEIYDIFGGRQQAEERHFVGLPGVRVIIHEFDLATAPTHGRESYPEPDYDQIGRARILHVFKDRGESEEREPVPSSWEGIPVLSGV